MDLAYPVCHSAEFHHFTLLQWVSVGMFSINESGIELKLLSVAFVLGVPKHQPDHLLGVVSRVFPQGVGVEQVVIPVFQGHFE